jgi:hypothetical protein
MIYAPTLLIFIFLPFISEPLHSLVSFITFNKYDYEKKHEKKHSDFTNKKNIIFHFNYDITAFGIEKCHPFDSTKYSRIYGILKQNGIL